MGMTVVICCSNDFDLAKTIASIDADVQIIVSATPNSLLETWMRVARIDYVLTPRGNHSATTNAGMQAAVTEKVFVLDSDTVLTPGTLRAVELALDENRVVNVPIIFEDTGGRISRSIAACRNFDNVYYKAAYKPGIGFRSDVRSDIGGYWFDERILWACDSELLWRLNHHGIPIHHLDSFAIVHRPNTFKHVVRAYFHYGKDGWKRVSELKQTTHIMPLANLETKLRLLFQNMQRQPNLALNLLFDLLYILGFCWAAAATRSKKSIGADSLDDARQGEAERNSMHCG